MIDDIRAFERPAERAGIQDIGSDLFDSQSLQRLAVAVDDATDMPTFIDEGPYKVGPDVSGRAGYRDGCVINCH